jgi:Kef-type K+ transport system membrane component KefB
MTDARSESSPAVFWVSALAGWAVIAYGIRGLLQHHIDTRPSELGRFVIGAALLHDLLVAPIVLIIGITVARAVPARVRALVQAALIVSGAVALFSYPAVRGFGRSLHNPSSLPHNYATDLILVLGIVWAVASALAVISAGRGRHGRRDADVPTSFEDQHDEAVMVADDTP